MADSSATRPTPSPGCSASARRGRSASSPRRPCRSSSRTRSSARSARASPTPPRRRGYALHFISPLHGSLASAMGRATVDGVVAIGLSDDHPEVEQIRRAGLPIVLVDSTALPDHGSIDVDDEGGARAAAEHLIGLGHRDVLIVGRRAARPRRPSSSRRRHRAAPARLPRGVRHRSASTIPDDRIVVGPASIDGGIGRVPAAWRAGQRPTAVLAMSDAMAIGVMRAFATRPGVPATQRRRLRRHRPRPARGPAPHDGPPADPAQGRGGGPPAPDHRPATPASPARAPPAGDAAHRPRLDGPVPPSAGACRDARATMSVDTPDWVRDAIFYQVFPDRFAASDRVPSPASSNLGRAADDPGFKGGDLRGIVERLEYLRTSGSPRSISRRSSNPPRTTATTPTTTSRWTPCSVATTRSAS